MNKLRRKSLAEIVSKLEELDSLREEIKEMLQGVIDEEQEAYDSMPESLQGSERGETMQEGIDSMQGVYEALDEMDVTDWCSILSEI